MVVNVWRMCASVVETELESISTTLATQSRHVQDHMETRLKNLMTSLFCDRLIICTEHAFAGLQYSNAF